MATPNLAAKNARVSDWVDDYSTATYNIMSGATVLATHTLTGFTIDPATATATSNPIADATILQGGTVDSVVISSAAGDYTLTVGLIGSGADVIIDDLEFVQGGVSKANALTVSAP